LLLHFCMTSPVRANITFHMEFEHLTCIRVGGASPGPLNCGPQANSPKLPTVYCCTTQFHCELGQSPISALRMQWRFFAFSPPKMTNFQEGSYPTELLVCSASVPASNGKVILNSDNQIFSNRGQTTQIHPPQFFGGKGGSGMGRGEGLWRALSAYP